MNESDLIQLEENLKGLPRPSLNIQKKDAIRQLVFSQLNGREQFSYFSSVVALIRRFSSEFKIDSSVRARIKENVFAAIEDARPKRFAIYRVLAFQRKFVAAAAMIAIFMGMFTFVNFTGGIVRAETFTTLGNVWGEVYVERATGLLEAENGMRLYEEDRVVTGEDSRVIVNYFDDSVSRLYADSELRINELERGSRYTDSHVEVSVIDGSVWSKVVNLVDDDSSFVVEAKSVFAETKKAAFNVDVDSDSVQIEVFNRSVDVTSGDQVEKVSSGNKAVLASDVVLVSALSDDEQDDEWVKSNLVDDKDYIAVVEQRILDAKKESVSEKELDESLLDKISVSLTFDDVKKKKKEFEVAEKRVVAAELLMRERFLTDSEREEVEDAIGEYASIVEDFYSLAGEVDVTDSDYADELRAFADEKLLSYQKDLKLVSPTSPVYEMKELVDDLSLIAVADEEKQQKKLQLALDDLATIEEVDEFDDDVVNAYENSIEEVVELANSIEGLDYSEKVEVIQEASKYSSVLHADVSVPVDPKLVGEADEVEEDVQEGVVGEAGVEEVSEESLIEEGAYGVKLKDGVPLPAGL